MDANPWKKALVELRATLIGAEDASCSGQAGDLERGAVRGWHERNDEVIRALDDAIARALEAEIAQ